MTITRPPEDIIMTLSQEAQQRKVRRSIEYNAKHTIRVPLDLNIKTDADIIAFLSTVPSKLGLIKELLRNRMAEEGFTYEPDGED